MTREELLAKLRSLHGLDDLEMAHCHAINALLEYLNDPEITEAYEKINRFA